MGGLDVDFKNSEFPIFEMLNSRLQFAKKCEASICKTILGRPNFEASICNCLLENQKNNVFFPTRKLGTTWLQIGPSWTRTGAPESARRDASTRDGFAVGFKNQFFRFF